MRQQEQLSQFSDETWNPNMISVYPQGIDVSSVSANLVHNLETNSKTKNAWEGAPYAPPSEHPDKAFTTNLLNHIKSTYCIDTSRVFASGMSNGGGFVDTLACSNAHGRDFAAFAPVSGAFYDDLPDNNTCSPYMSVTPLLEFHGNNTAHIPYSGGPSDTGSSNIVPSIPGLLNRWAIRDGCTDPPTFQTSRQNDSDVEIRTYTCSGAQGNVIGYLIESMAHSWPSIKAGTAPIDATPIIIDFFNSHPKPA